MSKKQALIFSVVLVVVGLLGRLLPHAWNTTPMTAIILFASVYLGFRYSLAIFFATMAIADLFLGFYDWRIMIAVYGGFALAGLVGLLVKKHKTIVTVFIGVFSSSFLFFLVTNWAVWQFGTMYPHSFSGLLSSYLMAIPFWRNSLIGDLFYSASFFVSYELVKYVLKSSLVVNKQCN